MEGLGNYGRLAGIISTFPGASPTRWCRDMAKNHRWEFLNRLRYDEKYSFEKVRTSKTSFLLFAILGTGFAYFRLQRRILQAKLYKLSAGKAWHEEYGEHMAPRLSPCYSKSH